MLAVLEDDEVVNTNRTEQVRAHDGGRFLGHVALPDGGLGPGLVVIQEIFGVNGYIKGVCGRLAKLGYVAMAPTSTGGSAPESPSRRRIPTACSGRSATWDNSISPMLPTTRQLRSSTPSGGGGR